jgi:hypothetical protein
VIKGEIIAGYKSDNDVTQHLRIDLDYDIMENAAKRLDFTSAYQIYSIGNNHYLH